MICSPPPPVNDAELTDQLDREIEMQEANNKTSGSPKYSLRSLMIVVLVLPPLLAWGALPLYQWLTAPRISKEHDKMLWIGVPRAIC